MENSGSERKSERKGEKTRQRKNEKEMTRRTKRMEAAGKHDGVVEKGVEFRAHDGA